MATWVDIEGIMLSAISQRKTNTVWFYLYVKSKKKKSPNSQKQRVEWGLPEAGSKGSGRC